MGKIVLLDELTINQIAAGEVIERPASVVKEMLENSIDAGAKNIIIEIKNGGISLIRISDDGCGISEDDMEIAFERHATSKIRSASDLQTVKTMGFRGEALASIAAIANVEMISKTAEDDIGHKIVVEGGKIIEKSEIGSITGTKITVQNLFYNTPVRYKFLKKNYTEAGYIEDVVTRIALVNKGVAIKLINNDKVLLQTTGSLDTKNMIYSVYGKDIANGIKEVEYTYEDIKVTGVIGLPEIARSNRSNQLFFVNGRYVKDKNLTAAIEQAYKNLIPTGKYAFAILNLEMNANEVDVNVHPAKLEVRFQDEQKVFKAVYHTVKYALDTISNFSQEMPSKVIEGQEIIQDEKVSDNSFENTDNTITENNIEENNKKSFGGLFKKFKKEKENEIDDFEEDKNNTLLEIFNSRKNKQDLSKPLEFIKNKDLPDKVVENVVDEIPKVNVTEQIVLSEDKEQFDKKENDVKAEDTSENELKEKLMIANEDIAEKEIQIGDTLVSSNTRELDVNVNEALKDSTIIMDSVEQIKNQETTVIPNLKETELEETQIIKNINEEILKDEEIGTDVETIEDKQEVSEAKVPSLDSVEKITSKILEMKMNTLDSTQMIDTAKVREAMAESQKITPEFADMYKKTFGVDANEIRKEKQLEKLEREKINVSNEFESAENDSLFEKQEVKEKINYKFVGIAFKNYIIIEYKNEMYIIEENSARERINLERVKYNYYSTEKDSTSLLLPDIVTCTFKEMSIARENIELFRNAGFDFEEFGENTIKLTCVPSMCEEFNTKTLFLNILNEIGDIAVNDIQEKEKKFIRAVAINSIEEQKVPMTEEEIDDLIQDLLSLEDPFSAEQGRPTAIKMSRADIEKKFARRK